MAQLYRTERWRGKNSVASWKGHGVNLWEAPNVMIPALFMVTLIVGITALLVGSPVGISLLLMHGVFPLAYVGWVPHVFRTPLLLVQCYVVAYTYLLSRGVALFREVTAPGER